MGGDAGIGADREVEDLVPIDYLVVEFPDGVSDFGAEMRAEMRAEVAALVDVAVT